MPIPRHRAAIGIVAFVEALTAAFLYDFFFLLRLDVPPRDPRGGLPFHTIFIHHKKNLKPDKSSRLDYAFHEKTQFLTAKQAPLSGMPIKYERT
jgi:hypothetical protein